MDEPTTGFDPAARRQAWHLVQSLKSLGKTVFLTTHYMDEAEALADRVAIIAGGVIVAAGTPQALGGRENAPAEIRFRRPPGMDPGDVLGPGTRAENGWVSVWTPQPARVLLALDDWSREHDTELPGAASATRNETAPGPGPHGAVLAGHHGTGGRGAADLRFGHAGPSALARSHQPAKR